MLGRIGGLVAVLLLGACASPYVAKPYDRAAAAVRTVAVVDDALPEEPIAYEVASVGSNFGLIGALVDAGIQSSRQNAVNEALRGIGFDPETKLEARLISRLGAQGYTVRALNGAPRPKREFLATYPGPDGTADAYLDVAVLGYGYLSAGAGQPFRPTVDAKVRLVSAKDPSKALMENRIIYNGMNPPKGVVTLSPDPQYVFNGRAELLADPARTAAGIENALNQVADTAAQLLQ
jgi:hypothetical protein